MKHEQALYKLKDCFSMYSLKDYCGSGCLVYFYSLSLWKVLITLLQIIVLLSIFLLPLYFGSKRENACTWFCLVIWVSLIYRYFIGEGYQTLFGSNMIIYNMYGFRNHWHSLKGQLLYSLKVEGWSCFATKNGKLSNVNHLEFCLNVQNVKVCIVD